MGKIFVVSLGCKPEEDISLKAFGALCASDVIFCSEALMKYLSPFQHKAICTERNSVTYRCELAIEFALQGHTVAIVCSGDVGVYGIASNVLTLSSDLPVAVDIIPGVTAALCGASVLGAPLMQDFAVISLSDDLYSLEIMMNRLRAALSADFAVVLYSASPDRRTLLEALSMIKRMKNGLTVVGVVSDMGGAAQSSFVTTLNELGTNMIPKKSVLFIGNHLTYINKNGLMVTPLC